MPPAPGGPGTDTNVAFVLTQGQRIQVARALDGIVEGLPQSSSVLIDRAGRIVEIARKPFGVNLPAISALAAGCFATTHELAAAMGEDEYSLLFQHENDQQVYIWPVSGRALLVVLLKAAQPNLVDSLEERLAGTVGQSLVRAINEAQEPPRTVPAPKIAPPEIPAELRHRTRALTALIMDLQTKRADAFTPEVNKGLLQGREALIQSLSKRDWRKAWEICEGLRQWMLMQVGISQAQDVGQVLIRLYREIFTYMNGILRASATQDRLRIIYQSFFRFLSRQYPRVLTSEKYLTPEGVDVQGLWESGQAAVHDSVQLSSEFVRAMDALVRELLRVIYLVKGAEGREEAVKGASEILKKYSMELMPFGLDSTVGRDWTLIPSQN